MENLTKKYRLFKACRDFSFIQVSNYRFGDGTVENIEKGPKDYKVTVQFDDAGRKIMYAGFARLEKL